MNIAARLPPGVRLALRRLTRLPLLRTLRFALLRRTSPVSAVFGYDRGGKRIGRHYIEAFLSGHRADIRGRVLEVADNGYTVQYGKDRVAHSDVLHVVAGHPNATIISDLTSGNGIADECFDCIILTQTLQFIYDIDAVVATLHRILKPGGVALVTGSGISQMSRYDSERWGDYWRFTPQSARMLFERHFDSRHVAVNCYGNVLTAFAVLQGLTVEELTKAEIAHHDADYPVLVAIRAQKSERRV
jgi:SAM-dependent methyltransferase